MDSIVFSSQVMLTRKWMIVQLTPNNMKFPGEDEVWEFITKTWNQISTENAEKLLNEAMKALDE